MEAKNETPELIYKCFETQKMQISKVLSIANFTI